MPQQPQTDEVGLTKLFSKKYLKKREKNLEKESAVFSDLPTGVSVTMCLILVKKLLCEDFSRDGSSQHFVGFDDEPCPP